MNKITSYLVAISYVCCQLVCICNQSIVLAAQRTNISISSSNRFAISSLENEGGIESSGTIQAADNVPKNSDIWSEVTLSDGISLSDISSIIDIGYQDPYGNDYLTQKYGYGPTWMNYCGEPSDTSYSNENQATYQSNGIIFRDANGLLGIRNFSGEILVQGLEGVHNYDGTVKTGPVYTYYGISLSDNTVISNDYRTIETYNGEYLYDFVGGDASIWYVNESGELKVGIIGEPDTSNSPDLSYVDEETFSSWLVVPRIDEQTKKLLGSAVIAPGLQISVLNDYNPWDLDDNRGFVNGFYVISHDQGFYDSIGTLQSPDSSVRRDAGYGMVQASTGKLITKRIYQDIKWFEDGLCPVEWDNKWAYIDQTGKEVTDFLFDDASVLFDRKAYVKYGGCYHLIQFSDETGSGASPSDAGTAWKETYRSFLLNCLTNPPEGIDTTYSNMVFCLSDMNMDGIPEIAYARGDCGHDSTIHIAAYRDGQVVPIGEYGFGQAGRCSIDREKGMIRSEFAGAGGGWVDYLQLDFSRQDGLRSVKEFERDTSGGSYTYKMTDDNGNVTETSEEVYESEIQALDVQAEYTDYIVYQYPQDDYSDKSRKKRYLFEITTDSINKAIDTYVSAY